MPTLERSTLSLSRVTREQRLARRQAQSLDTAVALEEFIFGRKVEGLADAGRKVMDENGALVDHARISAGSDPLKQQLHERTLIGIVSNEERAMRRFAQRLEWL